MNETGKALLTVLDKVLRKSEQDPTSLTTAFVTELLRTEGGTKRNWPPGILRDGRAVEITETTVHAIALHASEPLALPEELEELREIQSRMDETIKQAERFSFSRVNDYLHARRDEMAASLHAGNSLPEIVVTPSREAVQRDFIAKQKAITGLLVKITHEEALPLARKILERFNQTVDAFLRDTEIHDRSICAGYGLEFHPSLLWKAAAVVAMRYGITTCRIPIPGTYRTPKDMLEGIVQF